MDHDKSDSTPRDAGQTTQSAEAPTAKGDAPPTTPMTRLSFGSFGASSAPSRLWGDRAEMEELDE